MTILLTLVGLIFFIGALLWYLKWIEKPVQSNKTTVVGNSNNIRQTTYGSGKLYVNTNYSPGNRKNEAERNRSTSKPNISIIDTSDVTFGLTDDGNVTLSSNDSTSDNNFSGFGGGSFGGGGAAGSYSDDSSSSHSSSDYGSSHSSHDSGSSSYDSGSSYSSDSSSYDSGSSSSDSSSSSWD